MARMGSPSWDFSKSWASNVTVAGAILSIALALAALPDQTHYINKGGYAILNLLFTVLVGMAPFCFNVFRKASVDDSAPDGSQLQYQGYIICFVVASGVTIWAVTAQMTTLVILLDELSVAGLASTVLIRTFQGVIGILEVGVMLYAADTMYWTAKSQMIERNKALAKVSAVKGIAIAELGTVHTPLSNWAPL